MSVAQLIALARKRGKVTTNMISDADLLEYLNIKYTDIHAAIVNIDKNYFWDEWLTDTVVDQSEYTLLVSDAATKTFGQYKIEKLGIKHQETDDFYQNILLKDWDEYDQDSSTMEAYGVCSGCNSGGACGGGSCRLRSVGGCGRNRPVAMISDKSIFVYPSPENSVVGGLKIQASRDLYELDLTMLEVDILIVKGYSEILTIGMLIDIYRERNLLAEKDNAIDEYNKLMDRMLKDLTMRKTTFITGNRPTLSRFN